jgi:hypothetical protein
MSFRQDELKRLSQLAISRWPSQVEREHPYVLAPTLARENLHDDLRARRSRTSTSTRSRGG